MPTAEPSAIRGRLRAEHRAEGERADGRERHAGRVRERRGLDAEPSQRDVPAVARKEAARRDDDGGARDRQADDEEPRGRRVAERVGEVVPEPALRFVHEREEARGDGGGRQPDQGAGQNETKVRAPLSVGLGVSFTPGILVEAPDALAIATSA
jgi:hypothetical protein